MKACRRASAPAPTPRPARSTATRSSKETASLRRQPDLADSCQIHMLFGAPKVVLILHGEPAFRGSSQRLGKRNAISGLTALLPFNTRLNVEVATPSEVAKLATADVVGLEAYRADEFACSMTSEQLQVPAVCVAEHGHQGATILNRPRAFTVAPEGELA